jgi:aminocarboxymuconate-semialdehyde decarboxylase
MQKNAALSDVKTRLKALATTPGTAQVLTLGTPPLETMVSPKDAIELSRIANDEMAELVEKYPDKFVAAVGCLPLNDIDASVKEAERAITKLGFKGVQIFSNINGETLDLPKFRPLYKKMAQHDLPIWIHPWDEPGIPRNNPLHWPYQTSLAMVRLVFSGVLVDYPDIKFIAHHCGGMIPFFEKRITKLSSGFIMEGKRVEDPVDDLRKFYVDTALYGGTPALMCGYAFFGADHMLYGTDAPLGGTPITRGDTVMYGHALETAHAIEQMNIPAKEKDKIFERNARRLLKLEN